MKEISDELRSRLSGETLTLCLCWHLVRSDGFELGLTDHDQTLSVDQVVYHPGAAIEAGTFVQSFDLKPTRAAGAGVLASDAIKKSDLRSGLWNGCQIHVRRVDWQRPDLGGVHVWSGFLSEINLNENGEFEAELASLKAELERPIGRRIQKQCDAVLGDARCGIEALGRSCDQRFQTCKTVFANTENFRGFPHLPGNDFVLSGPAASNNDGGKR